MATDRNKRDVAQRILEHATKLFARHGFVGASLRDIAKAVGIRKPSLLYHFPSKDELRKGVLDQMLAHWNEAVPRILRAATAGPEQFDAIAVEALAFFREDPDRARLLLRELLDRPDEIAPLVAMRVQPWSKIVCDYIRKGQEQGSVRADVDPEAYVAQVINLVLCGFASHASISRVLAQAEGDDDTSERLLQEMLRVAKSSLFVSKPGKLPVRARPAIAGA
ncbi:MAG: TetR/AcrR family transcriptional regulator [Deltaproteobacteria bacterium]|jgi:TetR/AcrR family transcriptional regulator|nr:TetR/AcrR family transcriptional regulator [Deltaproteobacteria bacterium]MBK8719428.1 TetR/AcrR family transcriptional regulator [Deltaproteobacteria bacterium]MBP7287153.1 TetR/AcrR family transcriptional regulator [Nannocystaceae bacterium]